MTNTKAPDTPAAAEGLREAALAAVSGNWGISKQRFVVNGKAIADENGNEFFFAVPEVEAEWQRKREALTAALAPNTPPSEPTHQDRLQVTKAQIPATMTRWHGGDSAPADWDGGPVLLRDRRMWSEHQSSSGQPLHWGRKYADRPVQWQSGDIIAYTPKPTSNGINEDGEVMQAGHLAEFILSLEIAPISDPHAGSKNGKELIRAHAAARLASQSFSPIEKELREAAVRVQQRVADWDQLQGHEPRDRFAAYGERLRHDAMTLVSAALSNPSVSDTPATSSRGPASLERPHG